MLPAGGRISRRTALLLAVGGLAQLSAPRALPATGDRAGLYPQGAPSAGVRARVEDLLAARARVLLRADRSALLAGVAPAARAAQEQAAVRAAAVPFSAVEYRISGVTEPDADGRIIVTAGLAHRLRGVDQHPAVLSRRLTFDRGPAGWLLSADEPDGSAALWDLGEVRAAQGEHCLVLGLGTAEELAGLVAVADKAVPAVSELWGREWPGRLLVLTPATEPQFARMLDVAAGSYQGIAAVTVAAGGEPAATPADRIMVNPEAFRGLSDLGRQVVITHEATHVATRAATRSWTPLWLSEGVADYTGYRGAGRTARQIAPELARDVAAGRVPTALPADADFAAGAAGIAQAYEQAWLACETVAHRFGPQRLVALYRAVGAMGDPARLDSVLQAELGLDLPAFTKAWSAELVRQLRR
ncbi:hypothetical protein [Kitasatospora arboriphila]|uniref:Peptidase MA-like domain-containing protein n=1 Tax=Kitasatospora arboriphila TaxID=258052 RepID=A0ABN1U684_9ACTN